MVLHAIVGNGSWTNAAAWSKRLMSKVSSRLSGDVLSLVEDMDDDGDSGGVISRSTARDAGPAIMGFAFRLLIQYWPCLCSCLAFVIFFSHDYENGRNQSTQEKEQAFVSLQSSRSLMATD